jgi:hypothetical protein
MSDINIEATVPCAWNRRFHLSAAPHSDCLIKIGGLCDSKENAPVSYQLAKDTPLTYREHILPETLLFLDDTCQGLDWRWLPLVCWQSVSALIAPLLGAPTARVFERSRPETRAGATGFIFRCGVVRRRSSKRHGLPLSQHLDVQVDA